MAKREPMPRVVLMTMLLAPLLLPVLSPLPEPVVPVAPVVLVPLKAWARVLKAVKLRGEVSTGLMANNMPAPQ